MNDLEEMKKAAKKLDSMKGFFIIPVDNKPTLQEITDYLHYSGPIFMKSKNYQEFPE